MKKSAIIFLMISFCALKTMAQKDSKKFSVGFGIEAGIPTSPLSDVYNASIGLTVRFSYHVGPGFITLTTGGVGYDPKTIPGVKKKVALEIPVRFGYKYIINKFFVMGELGYASFKTYYGQNGELLSTTSGTGIGALSAGINLNAFELGLRYGVNFKSSGGGDFGVRVGFNF
jgi:hypothetical protein